MNKLLICTMALWCTACQGVPDTRTVTRAIGAHPDSGAGSGLGDECGCPPGTEPHINNEGQLVCVVPECAVTDDCRAHEACVAGSCEPVPCAGDTDCAVPRVCVDGACVQPACDRCPGGYHCVAGAFPEGDHVCVIDSCATGADCPSRMLCVNGACVEDNDLCNVDADCPSGHCVIVPLPPPSPDDDCEPAPCASTVGRCVPYGGCVADAECPAGERCDSGACSMDPPPCTMHQDCPGGTCRYETGTCTGPNGCVDDADCPDGTLCFAGICGALALCVADQECGGHLRCIAGVCTDCSDGVCDEPPPGPGPGEPGPDAGVPPPDSGLPPPDADPPPPDAGPPPPDGGSPPPDGGPGPRGPYGCPFGCDARLGYQLFCPVYPITFEPSWCLPSPVCGEMDACQAGQLAECNLRCPFACVTIPYGPVSCCDCGAHDHQQLSIEVAP